MTGLRYLAAASILAVPVLFGIAPAEAVTARQQALQGRGIYTTSKGLPEGYQGGGYVARPRGGYRDRDGSGYRGYRRHQRYDNGY